MAARIIHFDKRPRFRRLAAIGIGAVALALVTAFVFQPVPEPVRQQPSIQPANSPWKVSPFGAATASDHVHVETTAPASSTDASNANPS